jgi:hypothetical protein
VGFSRILDALQIHASLGMLYITQGGKEVGMWVSFPKGFGKLSTKLTWLLELLNLFSSSTISGFSLILCSEIVIPI